MRLIGAYGMEDRVPLATWMDIGNDGITANVLGCPQTMKAIGKPVNIAAEIDINCWELDSLLVGLGIFSNHRLIQLRAGLGAFGGNFVYRDCLCHEDTPL